MGQMKTAAPSDDGAVSFALYGTNHKEHFLLAKEDTTEGKEGTAGDRADKGPAEAVAGGHDAGEKRKAEGRVGRINRCISETIDFEILRLKRSISLF